MKKKKKRKENPSEAPMPEGLKKCSLRWLVRRAESACLKNIRSSHQNVTQVVPEERHSLENVAVSLVAIAYFLFSLTHHV